MSTPPVQPVTIDVRARRDRSERYQVLGEIGRGGVGIVYKGRDQDLGRDVAVKMLKEEHASRADILARFVEEAQIGGQLQHPGIVPVYELGLQSGERPYFAMKLVKGETLAAQLARRSDATADRRRLLGVFEQVCQTMAYAHSRHVVHRDLKPANVMIGAFGEVQVVDWGLAKVLHKGAEEVVAAPTQLSVIETVRSQADSGSHSLAGSTMGTPAYMPPEQALGDVARVDERSDVFALGAILCEILTGDAPYRSSEGDLVRQAANAELSGAHERLMKSGADEALIALTKECLAPSQRARPASAAEVAERVSAYLTSVEERAHQAEVRAAEARLKNRVTLFSAAAGLVVLALGASGWMWVDSQGRARRDAATERVASAMSAASGARGRAQSAGLDTSLWSTAVASAEQLVSLAQSDDVDASARGDAEALLAAVTGEARAAQSEAERRARDRAMLAELEVARMPTDEDVRKNITNELRRLDRAYAAAFVTYLGGVSPLDRPTETTLAALRRGDIAVELAATLDHWGLVRDALRAESDAPDPAGTARLREIAVLLDGADPWRSRLRALLPNAAGEAERLRELAAAADFDALPGVGCRVLGQALWSAGEKEAAVEVLRRGQERHPTDFDLCFHLALSLDLVDPPRPRESLAVYRIAQAIRPEHFEVVHRQLLALWALGSRVDEERLARVLLARDPTNVHALTHVGLALKGQGRIEEAIECYRRALSLDPGHASAYDGLGDALDLEGRLDEALDCRRKGLELKPESAHFHTALGFTLHKQEKLDDSIACYRKALELDPDFAAAHSHLGSALLDLGRLDEAITSHRRAVELAPYSAEVRTWLGKALAKQGRLDEAIAVFRQAIELNPQFGPAHNNLGSALADRGRLDEAVATHRRAIELEPKSAPFHNDLGNVFLGQGQPDDAMASYRRAIELDPEYALVHVNAGFVLLQQASATRDPRKVDDAIASCRRALELDPKSAPAYSTLGRGLEQRGQLEEAIASYRRAIAIDPRSSVAHGNLGLLLKRQGKLDEAIASFRRVIEIDPKDAKAHVGLGNCLADQGKHDEAIANQRRAIELDPNLAQAHFNLGVALTRQGKLDEAIAIHRRAIELDPKPALAHYGLGRALAARGDLDEAIASYRRATEIDPNFWMAYSQLGNSLQLRGMFEEAVASYRRAVEIDPQDAPSHFNLGICLGERGRLAESLASLRRAESVWATRQDAFSVEWRGRAQQEIQAIQRNAEREPVLLAVARGEREPQDAQELADSAFLACRRRDYMLAGRTYARAFEAFPALLTVEPHRYNAACCAARAGCDPGSLADAERTAWRERSRSWLGDEVARWRANLGGTPEKFVAAKNALTLAGSDSDFAGVRGDEALGGLPAAEAESWRTLWREIDALAMSAAEKR